MTKLSVWKNSRTLWIAFATVALFAIAVIAGVTLKNNQSESLKGYQEVSVQRGSMQINIQASGAVEPENRVEVKPPIAGRIENVFVDEGKEVKKGELLALMSSMERATLLDAASAKGPRELKRWEQLYRPMPIVAPLSGTLILRNVEPGQTFSSADVLFAISDRLIVKAQVDETDIAKIQENQKALIELDAYPGVTMEAQVRHIAFDAKLVNNITTYLVDVLPSTPPAFMRSGMTANVTFLVQEINNVLLIPTEAIRTEDNGKTTVLVKDETGSPIEKEVQVGASDGKTTEALSGLSEGDRVLLAIQRPEETQATRSSPFNPFGSRRPSSTGGGRAGGTSSGGGAGGGSAGRDSR